MMRRVVVTGMGMVTPLGCGVEHNWSRLIAGESGARKIDTFEVSDITCQIAGMIPVGDGTNGTYNADQWMEPKEQRKVDKFIVYAMCAAKQALDDAGWHPKTLTADDQYNTGVLIGTIFLAVCLKRAYNGDFTPRQHFGFEAAAWYWHFVDVVWLFLFAAIYVWGSGIGHAAH